ncbi:MAG: 16S rRNA (uracil(1498)-N(3))-methyltransferase [Candidatus Omnitrophica bacterium]|nr:16S rRNA (uracil(1498)-N(3))-methyltransferase [Candidatus Omnitrophota bacterium]
MSRKLIMHRFISPNADLHTKTLTITDIKEIHHLTNVLRLQKGDEIAIFNGRGEEALARIENLSPKNIQIVLTSAIKKSANNRITLTLACAIPKKAKFETIIEKCTELGVDRIIPVLTERTEVRLSEERQEKKRKRYETVAINAAKQCQRNILPIIDLPSNFNDILKKITPQTAAFIPCLSGERKNLVDTMKLNSEQFNIIFFIGPEGDFTTKELKAALSAGCIPVTLGPNVLKVDTAAIATIAVAKLILEKISE